MDFEAHRVAFTMDFEAHRVAFTMDFEVHRYPRGEFRSLTDTHVLIARIICRGHTVGTGKILDFWLFVCQSTDVDLPMASEA